MEELLGLFEGNIDEFEFIACRFCDAILSQQQKAQQTPTVDLSTACFQSISPSALQALSAHESNDAKVDAFEEDAVEIDESSGNRKVKRKGIGGFMSDLVTKIKDTAKKVVEGDTRAKLSTQLAASQRLIQEGLSQYGLLRIEILEAHCIPGISKTALTDSFCRAFVVSASPSQAFASIARHNLYITKTQIGRTEPAWLEQFSLAFSHVMCMYIFYILFVLYYFATA
jgi:hypothetical protein